MGNHDPLVAHERVKAFYNWEHVSERTEVVYRSVLGTEPIDLWTRMLRYAIKLFFLDLHTRIAG